MNRRSLFNGINIDNVIINIMEKHSPKRGLTRSMIKQYIDIPRTTIYESLVRSIIKGKIITSHVKQKTTTGKTKPGRPSTFFRIAS